MKPKSKNKAGLVVTIEQLQQRTTGVLGSFNSTFLKQNTPSRVSEPDTGITKELNSAAYRESSGKIRVVHSSRKDDEALTPTTNIKLVIVKSSVAGSVQESENDKVETILEQNPPKLEQQDEEMPVGGIQYEPKLQKNQSSGGIQVLRYSSRNEHTSSPSAKNFMDSQQQIQMKEILVGANMNVHAQSSAQLHLANNQDINLKYASTQLDIHQATTMTGKEVTTTQDSTSKRQLLVPSTHHMDLTETQSQRSSSTFSIRKKSLPMATFKARKNNAPIKQNMQSHQQALGRDQSLGLLSVSQNVISESEQQFQSLVILGSASQQKLQKQEPQRGSLPLRSTTINEQPINISISSPRFQKQTHQTELDINRKSNETLLQSVSEIQKVSKIPTVANDKSDEASNEDKDVANQDENEDKAVFIAEPSPYATFTSKNQWQDQQQNENKVQNPSTMVRQSLAESTFYNYVEAKQQLLTQEKVVDVQESLITKGSENVFKENLDSQEQPTLTEVTNETFKQMQSNTEIANVSFGGTPSQTQRKVQAHHQLSKNSSVKKMNRALFINKNSTEMPQSPLDSIEQPGAAQMKRLLKKDNSLKYLDEIDQLNSKHQKGRSQSPMGNDQNMESKDSELMRFLKSGEIMDKSRNSVETIKQLFGSNHVECRDMINDLMLAMTKSEVSLTQERAMEIINRPKNVPYLEKKDYQVNAIIEKEAKINPLLIKSQQNLDLPQAVKLLHKRQKYEIAAKKAQDANMIGLQKTQSQTQINKFSSSSSKSFNSKHLHQSAPKDRKKPLINDSQSRERANKNRISSDDTPIIIGQRKLTKDTSDKQHISLQLETYNQIRQSIKEGGRLEMNDIKALNSKIAMMKKLEEKQAKAQMSVIKHELAKNASRQRAIDAMKECRLVQSSLQQVQRKMSEEYEDNIIGQSVSLSPKAYTGKRGLFQVKPKKFVPVASTSIMPNTELRDDIIKRIIDEQDEQKSINKQVAADRMVRSIARQQTWQSITKRAEREASQGSDQAQKFVDLGLSRVDSASRRRNLADMNQNIKLKNLQQIYQLKSLKLGRQQAPNKKASKSIISQQMQQLHDESIKEQKPMYESSMHSSPNMRLEARNFGKSMVGSQASNTPLVYSERDEEDRHSFSTAIREQSEERIMSSQKKSHLAISESPSQNQLLPRVVVQKNTGYSDKDDNFLAYQNVLLFDQSKFPGSNSESRSDEQAVRQIVTATLSHDKTNNDLLQNNGSSTDLIHVERLVANDSNDNVKRNSNNTNMQSNQKSANLSMAEMIQIQAQQIYYQDNAINESNHHNNRVSNRSSLQQSNIDSGRTPSARFYQSGQKQLMPEGIQGKSQELQTRQDEKDLKKKKEHINLARVYQNVIANDESGKYNGSTDRSAPVMSTAQASSSQITSQNHPSSFYKINLALQGQDSIDSANHRHHVGLNNQLNRNDRGQYFSRHLPLTSQGRPSDLQNSSMLPSLKHLPSSKLPTQILQQPGQVTGRQTSFEKHDAFDNYASASIPLKTSHKLFTPNSVATSSQIMSKREQKFVKTQMKSTQQIRAMQDSSADGDNTTQVRDSNNNYIVDDFYTLQRNESRLENDSSQSTMNPAYNQNPLDNLPQAYGGRKPIMIKHKPLEPKEMTLDQQMLQNIDNSKATKMQSSPANSIFSKKKSSVSKLGGAQNAFSRGIMTVYGGKNDKKDKEKSEAVLTTRTIGTIEIGDEIDAMTTPGKKFIPQSDLKGKSRPQQFQSQARSSATSSMMMLTGQRYSNKNKFSPPMKSIDKLKEQQNKTEHLMLKTKQIFQSNTIANQNSFDGLHTKELQKGYVTQQAGEFVINDKRSQSVLQMMNNTDEMLQIQTFTGGSRGFRGFPVKAALHRNLTKQKVYQAQKISINKQLQLNQLKSSSLAEQDSRFGGILEASNDNIIIEPNENLKTENTFEDGDEEMENQQIETLHSIIKSRIGASAASGGDLGDSLSAQEDIPQSIQK